MSNSPFADFANSTLRFQVASGALVPDGKGNLRPGKAVVEVSAMLDQARSPSTAERPGVDTTAVYLEGFVVEVVGAIDPLTLPSIVTPDSPCAAVWAGRSGQFFLELTGRSPFGYEAVTGDELKGYFQLSNFIVEGEAWVPSPSPSPVTEQRDVLVVQQIGQTVFTLTAAPTQPQLSELYINGVKATYGTEYVLDGLILTWTATDLTLQPEDEVEILYL